MILETIVQAIEKSGKTRYQISLETKIDQGTLSRVMNGKCGLRTADRLCKYFGLELRPQQVRKGK